MERKPIGQLLKERGFITEDYIQFALLEQKATGEKLGEVLVRIGLVTDLEIAIALAEQSGLPFVDLSQLSPSKDALNLIPPSFARKHKVLPIRLKQDRTLELAISDPFNFQLIEAASRVSGLKITPVIASSLQINKAIEKFYYFLENPIEDQINTIVERLKINPQADFNAEELLEKILILSIIRRATDLHITPTEKSVQIYLRIDGVLEPLIVFPRTVYGKLVNVVKIKGQMDIAESRLPQDGRMQFSFLGESFDLRLSSVRTPFGENLVLRFLPSGAYAQHLFYLGFSSEQIELIHKIMASPYGMFLVTGPTGSGKTTTLFACLRTLNLLEKNVLTAEDPIEYSLPLVRQTQVHEEIGYTFAKAIRHFLRQDPDVILVGEIRDEETVQMAIRAALTGHLFLSTLHTNNAISTIFRLKDLRISSEMIASTLVGLLAQRLVRKICPYCREEYQPDPTLLNYYELPEDIPYYRGKGCEACRFKGYLGRTVISEIIYIDKDFIKLLSKDASLPEFLDLMKNKNIPSLKEDAKLKVLNGLTTVEEIKRVVG
ncbi:secretion system protein E [Thermodesulfobacterium sp. TA1]|uniref:GspE/PulE family protein n=1 Tax=Thermodesulfobacterium sp. TA1 TaxID=2234087 RepID=UPI001232BB44|nr:GspE/PulE family protein [Thermodesulfobacterium sp. TA1]QER42612.1 secretion system protein E [Thermodesulfobacterium sp. TA1]